MPDKKSSQSLMPRDQAFAVCLAGSKLGISEIERLYFSHETLRMELKAAHAVIELAVCSVSQGFESPNMMSAALQKGREILEAFQC